MTKTPLASFDATGDDVSAPTGLASALSEIADAIAEHLEGDTLVELVPVPKHPDMVLRCEIREGEIIDRLRDVQRRSKDPQWKDGDPTGLMLDPLRLAANLIADTCTSLAWKGTEATNSKGRPLTFKDSELAEMVRRRGERGALTAREVVVRLFVDQRDVLAAGDQLSAAWGMESAQEVSADPLAT